MSETIPPIPDTARIYVFWHPKCRSGAEFARTIFDWFRLPSGFGIPVFYRSASHGGPEHAPFRDAPCDVPLGECPLNLIVLLADEHMVADLAWREWLQHLLVDLEGPEPRWKAGAVVYPVALHRTAYNLPVPFRALNYISLQDAAGRGAELAPADLSQQKDRLLKRLTEAFARLLIGRIGSEDPHRASEGRPKLKVFISHAKADGTEKAKSIRDYIYRETQLTAFFDENDIALGSQFAGVLRQTLETDSAALIAVQGDYYASRPWCRREVQLFRKPRRLSELPKTGPENTDRPRRPANATAADAKNGGVQPATGAGEGRDDGSAVVWTCLPILLVNAMQGEESTFSIPELGSAPMLRWRTNDEARYIDMLLRDCILRAYHLQVAREIAARFAERQRAQMERAADESCDAGQPPAAVERAVINWTPDPLSVSLLLALRKKSEPIEEIIYPGGRLSGLEIDLFEELFPGITFRTYGDVQRPA